MCYYETNWVEGLLVPSSGAWTRQTVKDSLCEEGNAFAKLQVWHPATFSHPCVSKPMCQWCSDFFRMTKRFQVKLLKAYQSHKPLAGKNNTPLQLQWYFHLRWGEGSAYMYFSGVEILLGEKYQSKIVECLCIPTTKCQMTRVSLNYITQSQALGYLLEWL